MPQAFLPPGMIGSHISRQWIAVIADDLTGACDTGVQLAGAGRPCPVVVADSQDGVSGTDLRRVFSGHGRLVVDTESRHIGSAEARGRAHAVAKALREFDIGMLYKKVDSTLRGRIAAEIDGVRSVFDDRVIVIAPAYPAAGRTTEQGMCLVDGIPVHKTEFGTARRSPVSSSRIADHLPVGGPIRHTTGTAVSHTIAAARPGDMIVVDARTSDDLATVARHVVRDPGRYLLVGSAGLASALRTIGTLTPSHGQRVASSASTAGTPSGSGHASASSVADASPGSRLSASPSAVLGVVGSLSERSRAQAGYLLRRRKAVWRTLEPARPGETAEHVVRDLEQGDDVLVATAPPLAVAPEPKPGYEDARADEIAQALGGVARHAVERVHGIGLFLTGGDTAIAVLSALAAREIHVRREIAPGVPAITILARVNEEDYEIPAITKAGGFGGESIMDEAFVSLREGRCWV